MMIEQMGVQIYSKFQRNHDTVCISKLALILKVKIMAEQDQLKQNLQNPNQWMRILYMFLFWVVLYFSMMITGVVIIIQVLFALITGSDNKNIRQFAAGLTQYINQIILFLTYNENRKPFPFAAWGEVEAEEPTEIKTEATIDEHEAIIDVEPDSDKPDK